MIEQLDRGDTSGIAFIGYKTYQNTQSLVYSVMQWGVISVLLQNLCFPKQQDVNARRTRSILNEFYLPDEPVIVD